MSNTKNDPKSITIVPNNNPICITLPVSDSIYFELVSSPMFRKSKELDLTYFTTNDNVSWKWSAREFFSQKDILKKFNDNEINYHLKNSDDQNYSTIIFETKEDEALAKLLFPEIFQSQKI